MSRAYRIRVSESIRRVVRVDDGICAPFELLPVLPKERMSALLAIELEKRGFEVDGAKAKREDDRGVVIEIDLEAGQVAIKVEQDKVVAVSSEAAAVPDGSEDQGRARLEEKLRTRLENEVDATQEKLRRRATEHLEGKLGDLRGELDTIINRATAEALKERARQLGEIEELREDTETGSLTIKVRL